MSCFVIIQRLLVENASSVPKSPSERKKRADEAVNSCMLVRIIGSSIPKGRGFVFFVFFFKKNKM